MKSNLIVWFDIPVTDLDRSIEFYSAVLGQTVQKQSGPGFAIGIFDHDDERVGGCLFVAEEPPTGGVGPLLYFNAEGRLDAAVTAVESHGGKVLQPKHSIGPHGYRAVVTDVDGNRIALHSQTD